jgi:WD40 repeat protein
MAAMAASGGRVSLTALDARHTDFVHDVAYDYYGQRLATCASDLTVRVFDWVRRAYARRVHKRTLTDATGRAYQRASSADGAGQGAWVLNDKFQVHSQRQHMRQRTAY